MTHVLIVEDDPHIALIMSRLLERHVPCRVTVTSCPDEAMAVLDRDPVAAIVLDVSLRDARLAGVPCNGAQLSRHVRQHPRHGATPILLATAHAMRGDAERLLAESGADAYVAKPFVDTASLVDPVKRLLAA